MGDAHDSVIIPADHGLICVQRERIAEDLSQDACTDVQYACNDGWDISDSEYTHEEFVIKCKHRCFFYYLYPTHSLGMGGPIG
jgi:hypothetical protein